VSKVVRTGTVINLSLPLNYPITLYDMPTRSGYKHHIEVSRAGRDDYIDNFAMQGSTQWDSLRHIRFREFGYYGGPQDKDLDEKHALGIERWARHGIVGRGIPARCGALHKAAVGAFFGYREGSDRRRVARRNCSRGKNRLPAR
jgi:hypothetical protein